MHTMIQLRDYQERQLSFINNKINTDRVISVQSPTGSGKTFVMLKFIEDYFAKHSNSTIIISTGFNDLVYLFDKRARDIGLNPYIGIGSAHAVCAKFYNVDNGIENWDVNYVKPTAAVPRNKVFDRDTKYKCSNCPMKDTFNKLYDGECPYRNSGYKQNLQLMNADKDNKLIITNHSYLIISNFHSMLLPTTDSDVTFIDEAHTFSTYYSSFMTLNFNKKDLIELDKAISSIRGPLGSIIKKNISKGVTLPSEQINKILSAMPEKVRKAGLGHKVMELFGDKGDKLSYYIESSDSSLTMHKFYRYYSMSSLSKIVLFSATVDDFTKKMFQLENRSAMYEEYRQFIDYSKSEFILIPNDDFNDSCDKFISICKDKGLSSGLILSTTIKNVMELYSRGEVDGYKIFTSLKEFEMYECKKILVGSRALFQGIDIHGLDFVAIDRIPFPTYDTLFQARSRYLSQDSNFDGWNDFTIPFVENDLIQSTGRLWRSADSNGLISVFDSRGEKKFKYILRHSISNIRKGIKTYMLNDDKIEDFILKKDIKEEW